MKFAQELDESAIAEWKDKYFDYKAAKKKLKVLGRAVRNVDRPSPLPGPRRSPFGNATSVREAPVYSFLNRAAGLQDGQDDNGLHPLRSRSDAQRHTWQRGADEEERTTSRARPLPVANERSPLRSEERADGQPRMTRYGSIIGSPPSGNSPLAELTPQRTQASTLELPNPALDPVQSKDGQPRHATGQQDGGDDDDYDRPVSPGSPDIPARQLQQPDAARRQLAHRGNAYEVREPTDGPPAPPPPLTKRYPSFFLPRRTTSVPDASRPVWRRMLSMAGTTTQNKTSPLSGRGNYNNDVALEAYREADFRQAEFFFFLDKQLEKIEDFYHMKENEATERLEVLREQLHILRNRRVEEVVAAEQHRHNHLKRIDGAMDSLPFPRRSEDQEGGHENGDNAGEQNGHQPEMEAMHAHEHRWKSVTSQVDNALDKVRTGHVGKTSKAMEELGTPSNFRLNPDNRDYTRRNHKELPPYRTAKRKLKIALAEYYRGLELLKSYALLNRTAFRKINKKFDKTVNAPPGGTMRYMSEKVNKAHFVNSDTIDGLLQSIEDLYARYFERGNRKVAIGKLRGKVLKLGDYTGSLWRAGLFLGSGFVLAVQGTVYGVLDLWDPDYKIKDQSSYLLQIYAGYFLMLLLTGLFCIDARVFSRAKVNYQFVFEFDSRHTLDWRQLSEIPAIYFFLMGLSMYLNFTVRVGGSDMYIYWPVVMIGIATILMLLPPPLFYWQARRWFLYSIWRLSCAGLYPVEFRDFFLGDMFCSLTYSLGNIELFFCLYAIHWDNPPTCNSSHSRLLGFFSTLPGIWRALQCIRRYYDTRNVFPHLVNCGKYTFTILMYMSLSLFRINKTDELKGLFIAVSTINSIYCSIWDVIMDWSLGDPGAKHFLLRNTLAYKRHVWWYYVAMVLDPILRFNWIFYAIFADDIQHSSIISFAVGASETLFRVENEHCTNVSRNRAARDVELPFERTTGLDGSADPQDLPPGGPSGDEESAMSAAGATAETAQTTGAQAAQATPSASLRLRRQITHPDSPVAQALRRVGSTLANAHSQDYERKRKPVENVEEEEERESDDEEEDEEETAEAEETVRRARER